ncbi:MAG: cell division protein FtsQ [Saprospiraceae bacterium]|mgnify:CR=1 FL=1|jgi:cell division protein FtsQ
MPRKTALNTKKADWKKNLAWTVVTFVILGVLFMAIERKKNATITKVGISIRGIKGGKNLISKNGIKTMFRNYLGYDLKESSIRDLNLMDMEMMLEADDRIKEAEVFVDNKDRLYIAIQQREPIVRVFSKNKTSYYLDSDGIEIPAYKGSTIRVPVASGNIDEYVPGFLESKKKNNLQDVFAVAKYVHQDEFLTALIEQIDVQDDGEIILVPKVGRQKLAIGKININEEEEMINRFDLMKQMYKEGMKHVGWRKYEMLTVKYDIKNEDYSAIWATKKE